ncbi:MAG: helix-turn-helix domain-containing protein [Candidatus Pacearchaeota archaeon]|nr:helix-turn-helix domain-containing protein [Candidatus Pacearchaeota archaeon]
MNLEIPLKEYGLSEKEIGVYLALLPLGTINLQEISKRLEYPRTTIYNTLNYLINKGLVSKIIKKGITHFTAIDPEKLKEKIEEKKRLIEDILPQLKNLQQNKKESSSVQIFEGFKGVYTIISDVFNKKQQTYYFGGYKKSLDILKHLPDQARLMRLEKNIPAKIVIDPADEEIFHTKKHKSLTEMRFLKSLEDFPAMIFIYGNKVAIFTVRGDLVGMIVENKEFAEAMKMIFEMYWKQAKKTYL